MQNDMKKDTNKKSQKNIPSLSLEERTEIMNKYHSGNPRLRDEAVQQMLDAMDQYIYHLIHRRFSGYLNMIEDLAQSGRMAIIEHMGRYLPEYKPSTYFTFHIQNALQELVNLENGESHYYAESKNIITKTMRDLGMDMDNIDEQLLAIHLDMTTTRLHSILEKTIYKKKVELIEEDGETTGSYYDSPETAFMKSEIKQEFQNCLLQLDDMEQAVLAMHFGFYHPEYNEFEHIYKLGEIQDILDKKGIPINVLNEYRSARRHIADIISKSGLVNKRNRYQTAKEDIGLKFENTEEAEDLFEALSLTDLV